MTIFMSDILCITNRNLCEKDFLAQIRKIAAAHPRGIVLREKDLSEEAYRVLAAEVLAICRESHTPCILHSFYQAAAQLGVEAIHVPLPVLRAMSVEEKAAFSEIGASCHSVADAKEAERLGCTYITAGHIFETDCKKGLPGRGLDFLQKVCGAVHIPVYAIGGINAENVHLVRAAGAKGACVMSGVMRCEDVEIYLHSLTETD